MDSDEDEDMQPQGEHGEWEDWQEGGEDEDSEPTPSLFDPALSLPSPLAAVEHDAQKHGFNLLTFILQAHLDEYDIIRVINYIRHEVKQGRNPLPLPSYPSISDSSLGRAPWQDDKYLMPVLPEDPLLCFDFQEAVEQQQQQQQQQQVAGPGGDHQVVAQAHDRQQQLERQQKALQEENRLLRDENDALREMVLQLRLDVMPAELRLEEAERASTRGMASTSTTTPPYSSLAAGTSAIPTMVGGDSTGHTSMASQGGIPSCSQGLSGTAAVVGNAAAAAAAAAASGGRAQEGQTAREEVDASYFDSYSGFNIHREMLSDQPRTNAYRKALEGNPSLICGKRVLDVGCGTGILSLFASRAGARSVVAIDGSPDIAKFAAQIADANGYSRDSGGPVEVVSARVEQLSQLPGGIDKVDVIVSEWMGYALLFETMLDSVLSARDRWLAPGGVVLPDMASIHLAGAGAGALSNGPSELSFWKDVYGFNMEPIAKELREARLGRANVLAVDPSCVVTNSVVAKSLDLCTMKSEDQDFTTEFVLRARDAAPSSVQEVHAIVLWFDTTFSAARCPEAEVVLSTSPDAPITHWAQTVLPLKHPLTIRAPGAAADGGNLKWTCEIRGRLSMARNKSKHRSLDISLEHSAVLADKSVVQDTMVYAMNVLQ